MTGDRPPLIDTHAHLDDAQFARDLDVVIERALAAGVRRIVNIGYRPERWRTTLALGYRYPIIGCTFGLHPHHVDEWSPAVEAELIDLLTRNRPLAVGEIGLDFYRNLNPPELQRRVFERQLEIACDFGLPVVIHQRQAEDDLMHVLSSAPRELVCVLHSFDGTSALAQFAHERGHYLGVGGLMTRAGSEALRSILACAARDRLLIETDSPYLVPAGIKNRRNEPANVSAVVERLSALLQLPPDEMAQITLRNAERVFGELIAVGAGVAAPAGTVR